MKIDLVSKCSLDIEQYFEFKMSVLISPSKSLISSRWVTYVYVNAAFVIPGRYSVQKTLLGCVANMGSKICLLEYE